MNKRNFILSAILSIALLAGCTNNPSSNNNNNNQTSNSVPSNVERPSNEEPSIPEDTDIPTSDPYVGVDRDDFYNNDYQPSTSYEDAQYRTKHHLISGELHYSENIDHLPLENGINTTGKYVRLTNANYEYDEKGQFKSYTINSLDGESKKIYYNAGYVSMEEVAAYLLAFGEVPPNNHYSSKGNARNQAIRDWGRMGRCNYGRFYGNGRPGVEPPLPDNDRQDFVETDFGCHKFSTQGEYNDGIALTRGMCRFVFTKFESEPDITKRRVFYTYNHYEDFQEYLNYYGGWGERFGKESGHGRVSNYPSVIQKDMSEIVL